MTESMTVHYKIGDEYVGHEDAIELNKAELGLLLRSMASEEDVVYCWPEWCPGERVVFWGQNRDAFVLELQKSGEAMLYSREYSFSDVVDVVDELRKLWDEPLSNGLSAEQY